ncbi:MAG: Nif3-like dinuclear metal center hexameric protein [Bacteroidales bacterium]
MLLKELLNVFEEVAPLSLQESYDNSGIQVGAPDQEVTRGLACLEVTPGVLREAIDKRCDLIISHHPLIFEGIKRITGKTAREQVLFEAIRNNVAILSLHTNLDNVKRGVNSRLADRLGLERLKILRPAKGLLKKLVTFCPADYADKVRTALFEAGAGQIGDYDCCSYNLEGKGSFRAGENSNPFVGNPNELHYEEETRIETIFPVYLQADVLAAMKASHPYEEVAYDIYPIDNQFEMAGSGMIGELKTPMGTADFLAMVKEKLGAAFVRHSPPGDEPIQLVGLCGGSGAFLLQDAIQAGAQAFVTGDVKYHQFLDVAGKLLLVDAGHYETEQHTKELLVDIVKEKMINFALLISDTSTNPVRFF